jgi:hypothetical protein
VSWTRKQVKKLLSKGSPLTSEQQDKMKSELHANPQMGHAKKGSAALKKTETESSTYDWRKHIGRPKKNTWAR